MSFKKILYMKMYKKGVQVWSSFSSFWFFDKNTCKIKIIGPTAMKLGLKHFLEYPLFLKKGERF